MSPGVPRKARVTFRVLTALPSLAICVAIIAALVIALNQPTGYAARYEAPANSTPLPVISKTAANSRDNVNELVGSMAETVHQNATVKGTHSEGTTTITDYVLDREKYDYKDFERVARQIEPFLTDGGANRDGFVSSAFFNAKIMELSIEIENGIPAGDNVLPAISEVYSLGEDRRLSTWLNSSQFLKPYQDLKAKLGPARQYYESDPPPKPTDEAIDSLKRTIDASRGAFDQARAAGDSQSERTIAVEHDRAVGQFNVLVKQNNRLIVIQRGLDLAFNRCLDTKVLMSRFDKVDLTSGSDSQPEPTASP
jgi:hypothetical protein